MNQKWILGVMLLMLCGCSGVEVQVQQEVSTEQQAWETTAPQEYTVQTAGGEQTEMVTEMKEEEKMNLEQVTVNIQSSIRIEGTKILYFDPIERKNQVKDGDFVFITHEHYDHFEPASIKCVVKENGILVAPESMKEQLLALGYSKEQYVFLKPKEEQNIQGIRITAIPAYNINKPYHTPDKQWLGYCVEMDGICYYVAGDTDVTEEVRRVVCDVVFLPIGGTYTMNKEEAAEFILQDKPCKVAVPTHYGGIVGRYEDGREWKEELEAQNAECEIQLKLE